METFDTVFRKMAWYNSKVNKALIEVLDANQSLVTEEGTTYFGSILDMVNHIVGADMAWMSRLSWAGAPQFPAMEAGYSPETADFAAWKDYRPRLDADMEALCAALGPKELDQVVEYRHRSGSLHSEIRWQMLMHVLNHATHHRGQIAQVLDERKISNDYSNLIWYIRAEA